MGAVWQKIKADILSRPVISILILITIASSAALLTPALATLINTNAPYDHTFEEPGGAHVWFHPSVKPPASPRPMVARLICPSSLFCAASS